VYLIREVFYLVLMDIAPTPPTIGMQDDLDGLDDDLRHLRLIQSESLHTG
jgi:hypothetical protein